MKLSVVRNEFAKLVGKGINYPSVHEARWITDSVKYSPDLGWLEQFEYQLLFAADDTKSGHSHHCLIEDNAFAATAYTENFFQYWVQEVGDERIPIPMKIIGAPKPHVVRYFPPELRIKGELLIVRTPQFRALDNYKRNGVEFKRQRVNVVVPYRERNYLKNTLAKDEPCFFRPIPRCLQETYHCILSPPRVHVVRAWMYVAMPSYWEKILDGGFRGFKPVNYYPSREKAWAKEYYDYPKRKLEE
jgi:hypothetical protein